MPRAKAAAKPANAKKGKGPKAYSLPDPLPEGEILKDIRKGQWKIGKSIGCGGFGLIYLATPSSGGASGEYVVKVEPSSNGPLFSELSFYQRVAKEDQISEFKSKKKLKSLGVPRFVASGQHDRGGTRYRFMVMERFGSDLQKLFEQNGKRFPDKTVFTLGIQMLNALEYIHSKDYVHADIKASNMLLGYGKSQENQAFLVDYGLAFKCMVDGKHKEYKEDPRRCHDGTIEFTSIDAHKGVNPSRRGDLEILGYCLVQWLCGQLPWEDNLDNKDYVAQQKIKYMSDISGFLKKCSLTTYPEVESYLKYVKSLSYEEVPNYEKCKKIFKDAMKKRGSNDDGKLQFGAVNKSSPKKNAQKKGAARKRKSDPPTSDETEESSQDEIEPKRTKKTDRGNISAARQVASPSVRDSPAQRRLKSPPSAKASPARKRVQSPAVAKASPARKKVKSPQAQARAPPDPKYIRPPPIRSPGKARVCSPKGVATGGQIKPKKKKPSRPKADAAVQTSPGLKGLRHFRQMNGKK